MAAKQSTTAKTMTQDTNITLEEIAERVSTESMFNRWRFMMRRCYEEKNIAYKNYGGRGIYVCDEWHDFANYYAHFGNIPKGMTIDRIDNDGPYSPGNCRLATYKEQAMNRRSAHLIEFNGLVLSLTQWAEKTGMKIDTIRERLKTGWNTEDALTVPVERGVFNLKNSHRPNKNSSGFRGVSFYKRDGTWAAKIGLNGRTIDIGRYADINQAAHEYNKAAVRLHGEFACLNPVGV